MILNSDTSLVHARLLEASETGEPLELILVLRGQIRCKRGKTRNVWSVRADRRTVTFPADAVVAATPWRGAPTEHRSVGRTR